MKNPLRKALTKTVWVRQEQTGQAGEAGQDNAYEPIEVPPSLGVLYAVVFAVAALVALTALEIAHMAFLESWNTEIFAGIMSTVTFILGIFIGQKA